MAVRRGIWLVIALILVAVTVSAAALVLTFLMVGREPTVRTESTLVLRITGDLQELEPGGVFGQFIEAPPTVRSITQALRKAKVDRRVTGVIIRPTGSAALWGKAQEVRDAILDFKASGKPIVAFLEQGGEQEYFLASACDQVFLLPTASLDLTGLASYDLFLRGTLDKIGAYPDALHIGAYKTAANVYTERTYTPEHREMAEWLNRDLYDQLVTGLAEGRHKSEEEIRQLIDHGPFLAEDAVKVGLVDGLAYEDEVQEQAHLGDRLLRNEEYRQVSPRSLGLNRGPRIAVIYAVGVIATGRSRPDSPGAQVVGSETIVDALRQAREDRGVRAIILRVDSPGGSAIASDIIWREVQITRERKPVIASFSDVAASGGYYIAMPAHAIVAEPGTLTGSIGVVTMKFVLDGTLDKLGLNMESVSQGRFAEMYSPLRPFTPQERARVDAQMQATYQAFVEKAAEGRNTTPERIDEIGRGRVWTGRQARDLGLVDELGGLERALALARERAGIEPDAEVQLVVYPPRRTVFEMLRNPLGSAEGGEVLGALTGIRNPAAIQALTAPLRLFRQGETLALMPNVFVR